MPKFEASHELDMKRKKESEAGGKRHHVSHVSTTTLQSAVVALSCVSVQMESSSTAPECLGSRWDGSSAGGFIV